MHIYPIQKNDFLFEDTNKKLYCEKYLKIIINSSLDGIAVLDEHGKFEFANDSFFRITGWPKEEIIGQFFLKMIPEDAREFVMEHWKGIQTDHGGYHEIKIITKSGIIKYLNVSSSLADINGQNKIIAIVHDISENKRYEMNLKESEARYRDLFENAQDAMYVLDSESNFLRMNKVGIQTLGCTTEEVIGSNISKWVTPDSLRIINERRKKRLAGENVNQTDIIEIVCKNNEHRWVEIRTRVIRLDNGTIEIHGIARDITENRLLKKELSKSNKQRKLLYYLIQGTRGGKTRALILKHLSDRPYNANQLAIALNVDYKTIRHHLNVLLKNGVITKNNDAYNISRNIESDLNDINVHVHIPPAVAPNETPE